MNPKVKKVDPQLLFQLGIHIKRFALRLTRLAHHVLQVLVISGQRTDVVIQPSQLSFRIGQEIGNLALEQLRVHLLYFRIHFISLMRRSERILDRFLARAQQVPCLSHS